MWKLLILALATAVSGCAAVATNHCGDSRIPEYVAKLKPSFPNIKRVSVDVNGEVAGNVAGSKGNSTCQVVIAEGFIKNGVSDVELAFVLAHEMAHCDVDHGNSRRMFTDAVRFREQELLADKMALDATRNTGLGDISALPPDDLPFFLKVTHQESSTHPGGRARLNALNGISADGFGLIAQDGKIVIGRISQ